MTSIGSTTTVKRTQSVGSFLANTALILGAIIAATLSVRPAAAADDVAEIFGRADKASTATVDHSAWTKLLQTYVVPGADGLNRVKYRAFKAGGHKALKGYIATLQRVDPRTLNSKEQFAFWANLYNAKTIDVVLANYPVKSIRKISLDDSLFGSLASSVGAGGPWKTKIMKVAGVKLSLDDIEHGILRPVFQDPRVHYAVNCASVGCPNLGTEALTAANLDASLDAGAAAFINSPRGFNVKNGKVTASSIYKWFQSDFGGSEAGVLKHALRYASPKRKAELQRAKGIAGFDYDWNLNNSK